MLKKGFGLANHPRLFRHWAFIFLALVFSALMETAGETGPVDPLGWKEGWGSVHKRNLKTTLPDESMALRQSTRVGQFLVASETLTDPRFVETVVLLLQVDEDGAMGLVINRPTQLKLSAVLDDVEGLENRPDIVFFGGPVGMNQIFLLLRAPGLQDESKRILGDLYFSASSDLLHRVIGDGIREDAVRFMAGYAGWGRGQLNQEILRGDWEVLPADSDTVFQMPPSEIWPALIRRSAHQWVMAARPGKGPFPEAGEPGYCCDR